MAKPKNATKKHKFYKWIIKQTKRDDIIGDLAGDIARDTYCPVDRNRETGGTYRERLHSHIRISQGCEEAHTALDEAWDLFTKRKQNRYISVGTRFYVFKRDNYRCQICGATSEESRLEIVPFSKSGNNDIDNLCGNNDIDNLWVLCFECNRGKRAKEL